MNTRWAYWATLAGIVVVTLATAGLYAVTLPNSYTSSAVLSLSPRDPATVGADNLKLAAARYSAMLSSATTFREVAHRLTEKTGEVSKAAKVEVQPETVTVLITVTMVNPNRAAHVANALASRALQEGRRDEIVTVELYVPGVVAEKPSSPNRTLIMLGGLGVAALLTLGAWGILHKLRHYFSVDRAFHLL